MQLGQLGRHAHAVRQPANFVRCNWQLVVEAGNADDMDIALLIFVTLSIDAVRNHMHIMSAVRQPMGLLKGLRADSAGAGFGRKLLGN